jgi:hypothetical protein
MNRYYKTAHDTERNKTAYRKLPCGLSIFLFKNELPIITARYFMYAALQFHVIIYEIALFFCQKCNNTGRMSTPLKSNTAALRAQTLFYWHLTSAGRSRRQLPTVHCCEQP